MTPNNTNQLRHGINDPAFKKNINRATNKQPVCGSPSDSRDKNLNAGHSMISGSCHCGKSAFRIEAEMPQSLTRCSCSFCSKRGVLWAYFQPAQFHLTTSADNDVTYRWNTKLVAHHFCPVCGCGTFTDSPAFEPDGSWDKHTHRIGVNARLFDNFDAADAHAVVIDGKNLW